MKHSPHVFAIIALGLVVSAACGTQQAQAAAPTIGGCPIFPSNNVWNAPVDTLPVAAQSDTYVNSIGRGVSLHPDFGSNPDYGIPYTTAPANQASVNVSFDYTDESDAGPYPIPASAPVEVGSDHHVLVVQQGTCKLYELYDSTRLSDGSWHAGSGAVFDLRSNALRTNGWTSADAAGLPILPGLVRRDEVLAGEIAHALRFTAVRTRKAHIWPARHDASALTDPTVPPMGQRFRLKASVNIASFPPEARVILTALKKYGMLLADNGSNWYLSGAADTSWNDDAINTLKSLHGSDFEAVDESSLRVSPDSGQVPSGPITVVARLFLPIVRR